MEGTEWHTHQLTVDSAGRVVLPAEFRRRVGISAGDRLVAEDDGATIHIKPYEQVLREVQDFFRGIAPPGVLLSEELLKERREEAAREADE